MDSIEIRGLSCRCIVGIRPRERRVVQPVRLDLDIAVDLERAGKSGRISHTVDYSRASTEIIALLQFRCYSLLEMAAEECSGWLFAAYPAVQAVTLSITKPKALAGQADSSGVRITRRRATDAPRRSTPFGFVQPQLETSEASLFVVGLEAGASLTAAAIDAQAALILPLSPRVERGRLLTPHEPTRLAAGDVCTNRDSGLATLVVCARRAS